MELALTVQNIGNDAVYILILHPTFQHLSFNLLQSLFFRGCILFFYLSVLLSSVFTILYSHSVLPSLCFPVCLTPFLTVWASSRPGSLGCFSGLLPCCEGGGRGRVCLYSLMPCSESAEETPPWLLVLWPLSLSPRHCHGLLCLCAEGQGLCQTQLAENKDSLMECQI